jgi:hypothetical protein
VSLEPLLPLLCGRVGDGLAHREAGELAEVALQERPDRSRSAARHAVLASQCLMRRGAARSLSLRLPQIIVDKIIMSRCRLLGDCGVSHAQLTGKGSAAPVRHPVTPRNTLPRNGLTTNRAGTDRPGTRPATFRGRELLGERMGVRPLGQGSMGGSTGFARVLLLAPSSAWMAPRAGLRPGGSERHRPGGDRADER